MCFSNNLRNHRKRLHLTQRGLAERMVSKGFDCDGRTISRWERIGPDGKGLPSYARICALADCLDVDVAHLLGHMKGERYGEQDAADYLGLDPGAIRALRLLRPEFADGMRVEHGSRTMSLLILDVIASDWTAAGSQTGGATSRIMRDYRGLVHAIMDRTLMDTPEEAARERRRVERNVRAARFDLVESLGAMLRQRYAPSDRDEDYLSDKGREFAKRTEEENKARNRRLARRLADQVEDPKQFMQATAAAIVAIADTFSTASAAMQDLRSRMDESAQDLREDIAAG